MSEEPRNIRKKIKGYVPGIKLENSQHGIKRINIHLMGLLGHGKSSLINSCMCVVKDGDYLNIAGSGKDIGGKTTKRTSHHLTNTISITDNRGFSKMEPQEILEVCAQLRHLREIGDVEWKKDNLEETLRCIPNSYIQKMELTFPVIVHSCKYVLPGDDTNLMRELIKKCQEITEIPPVVVLTNSGPPDKRSGNIQGYDQLFADMGCTCRIFLENYTENSPTRSQKSDDQFLDFLNVCMKGAEHAIQQRGSQDPYKIFAEHVADQVKEEYKVKEKEFKEELKRQLEEEQNKRKRQLEEELNKGKRQLEEELNKGKRQLEEELNKRKRQLEEEQNKRKRQLEEEQNKMKRQLEKEQKKVSDLKVMLKTEENPWYKNCSIM